MLARLKSALHFCTNFVCIFLNIVTEALLNHPSDHIRSGFACKDKLDTDSRSTDGPIYKEHVSKITWMGIKTEIVPYPVCVFPTEQNVTTSASLGLYFSITKFVTIGTGEAK